MPINIAIDGNEANVLNRVGSNIYAFEIIKNIYKLINNHKKYKKINIKILLSSPAVADLPPENNNWQYKIIKPKKFWTQWALPIHLFLNQQKYNVFFTPGHYAPRLSPVPYVSSIMDLAFLHYPKQFKKRDLFQLKNWTKYSVKNARAVITISKFSKQDIINNYQIKKNKILIAYPGINSVETKNFVSLQNFNIKQPYILYLGTIQPRKNLIRLVESFERICRRLPLKKGRRKIKNISLVIAGKIGWLSQPILDRISKSKFKNNIILTGFVSEAEKINLIKNASCLCLVALSEGFGIPALEAMQLNTIPIVAKTSSLPEVIGKAGFLVKPNNITSIANAIEKALLIKAKDKAKLRTQMRRQVKKFDYQNSAKKILNLLIKIAK